MAAEKKITSRIQQKHDTAANWANATTFIPKKGEIVIYDAEYNTSGVQTQAVRFKIGDGSRTINNLPFALIDYDNRITSLENTVDGLGTAAQKDVGFFATAAQGTKADNAVPNTRKVNNKALSTDIKLEPSDVGVTESAFPGLKKTGTITGIKMNGESKGTSGVVDLGTVITAHQNIKILNTNNTTSQTASASEALSGSGTINLHKVAKTGSYNDLLNKPTIPTDTGATSVEVTGTGNAVTAASYNATNRKLTLTKGSTFLTSHQDISGLMPKSGGTFTGNISVPKTITFTDNTNPFIKMTTGGTDFYFQSTSGQFGLGPTWEKATHWDSNGNVTFPTTPKVGSTSLALTSQIQNGTLTIKQNGTTVQTFSANQSGNVTANITVPTFGFSNGVLTITT